MKKALRIINTEISHLKEKINAFKDCKKDLQSLCMRQTGKLLEKALKRYTNCHVNIVCKLGRWLDALEDRRHDIKRDIKQLENGWIPYLKKCKHIFQFLHCEL